MRGGDEAVLFPLSESSELTEGPRPQLAETVTTEDDLSESGTVVCDLYLHLPDVPFE